MRSLSLTSLALLAATLASTAPAASYSSLPQVDLGYEIHQAISFNETARVYNFTNIRFAQSPVGKLRFMAPVPPKGRNLTVQTGAELRICPQTSTLYGAIAVDFAKAYLGGNGTSFNLTEAEAQILASSKKSPAPVPDPNQTEDCLFLDVFVPKKVFDDRNNTGKKAPVLLWIYGGGYTTGWKNGPTGGNPSGFIELSQANGDDGLIFVEINYRLGALGFLGGPTLQGAGGVSNAGFYDQRLAIEWVAKYIHLFGGDGDNITLIGESAGAGSIMQQITAFGGQQGVSFQGAILQSPGQQPRVSAHQAENITLSFLSALNVSTIAEAQEVSSEAVIKANFDKIYYSQFGAFTYGPAVDGIFLPALPQVLLNAGAFAKDVKVMVGHNTNEGVYFANPSIQTDVQLEAALAASYPGIAEEVLTYITKVLYPATYDGSMPYTNAVERIVFFVTEAMFTCNTNQVSRAFGNHTYAYEFEVLPALHGNDVEYTFWNGAPSSLTGLDPLVAPLAQVLQGFIINFAKTGDPTGVGLPSFPQYGSNATEVGLNATGLNVMIDSYQKDPTNNIRCQFWGKGLFN